MGTVRISELPASLRQVLKAADVNQDDVLSADEIARVGIRDGAVKPARVFEVSAQSAKRTDDRGDRDGISAAAKRQASSSMAQLLGTFTAPSVAGGVTSLTQRAYQDALNHFGQPNFGPAQQVLLAQVPPAARARIDSMMNENKGARLQVATWSVNGEQVYFAHAIDGDHAEVIALAANGSVYAKGVALEESNAWNITWRRD